MAGELSDFGRGDRSPRADSPSSPIAQRSPLVVSAQLEGSKDYTDMAVDAYAAAEVLKQLKRHFGVEENDLEVVFFNEEAGGLEPLTDDALTAHAAGSGDFVKHVVLRPVPLESACSLS
mmetsp:Transcript_35995/g.81953  ORF Transcript_35995/g.81953 Transcript_35995/m.81953 type:complete len:119 (-) Transcript_35995:99-455(-)